MYVYSHSSGGGRGEGGWDSEHYKCNQVYISVMILNGKLGGKRKYATHIAQLGRRVPVHFGPTFGAARGRYGLLVTIHS